MKQEIVVKRYGIARLYNGRWAICIDVSEDKKYYNEYQDLSYVKKEFAIQKARHFIEHCYCNFVNFLGVQIIHKFEYIGEI